MNNSFVDGRAIANGQQIQSDVCVIGAGAAGITLALEFIGAPFRVALIESGGLEPDWATQELYKGANTGHPYFELDTVRSRLFGGTTDVWGGHCVPMRSINFEPLPWIPYSGWPITRNQLDPFYQRAHQVARMGEYNYNPMTLALQPGKALFPFDDSKVITVGSRYNPLHFGKQYAAEIRNSPNITTYLYSNVVSINRHRDSDVITDVELKTLQGNRFHINAKYFILSTGGIENTRLLLLSNNVQSSGLGNQNDLVGRFFMEHIWYPNGYFVPTNQNAIFDFYTRHHPIANDIDIMAHISFPEAVIRRERIPDFRAEIGLEYIPEADAIPTQRTIGDKPIGSGSSGNWDRDIVNMLCEIAPACDRTQQPRGLIRYRLGNYSEQVPNPESRITLVGKKDALGYRRVQLHWQLTELDKWGIRRAQELIAQEVGRSGFGRLRMELKDEEELLLKEARGGAHHMGTTRMGDDPKTSVVDKNCRVHGLHNLYVAGTSVFPTGGFANPTLTVVALSIRLADHVKTQFSA